MITSTNTTSTHGEISTTRGPSTVGRGQRIPDQDGGYVVYVGTTAQGRDWLIYSSDLENCPGLEGEYYRAFDTR